jgi:hypothetical protein
MVEALPDHRPRHERRRHPSTSRPSSSRPRPPPPSSRRSRCWIHSPSSRVAWRPGCPSARSGAPAGGRRWRRRMRMAWMNPRIKYLSNYIT